MKRKKWIWIALIVVIVIGIVLYALAKRYIMYLTGISIVDCFHEQMKRENLNQHKSPFDN